MNQIVIIIGVVVLLLAAGSYSYSESTTDSSFGGFFTNTEVTHPYRDYSFAILIVGIALLIVGAFIRGNK